MGKLLEALLSKSKSVTLAKVAKVAKVANPTPQPAKNSQDSQDSQRLGILKSENSRDDWPLKDDGIPPDQLPDWYHQNMPVVSKPDDTFAMREYLLALADELHLPTTVPIRRLTEEQLLERCELSRWRHKDWLIELCQLAQTTPTFRSCDCIHWQPDKINPAQGMGHCKCGAWYPNQRHACNDFEENADG